ncbi:hypothetical protein LPJ73_006450, partial [Coemansia sp. RSA 2703]
MKLIFIPVFAATLTLASESRASIFDGIKWPWSTKGSEDMPIPGSNQFDWDVSSTYSPRCIIAMSTLKQKFDLSCFQNSKSLYFSSPGTICTPQCLNTTIELSRHVVKQCNLESKVPAPSEAVGYNHKDFVYLSWADKDLAELICRGPAEEKEKWEEPG